LGALYTEDAILITPEGPISGRAEIEKRHAEGFKVFTQTEPSKLDQVKVIGSGVRIKSGTWAGTAKGPSGPLQIKGYWATTDVSDGVTWKIRMEVDNTSPARSSEKK
jgi:ketosteroid isomerase-like protein